MAILTHIAEKILSMSDDYNFPSPHDEALLMAIVRDDHFCGELENINSFEDAQKVVESAISKYEDEVYTMSNFFADSIDIVLMNEIDEDEVSYILWDCIQKLKTMSTTMSKEKDIVLKIFTKRVGDHPYRETALKYLGLAMDKVKFPTTEDDKEIEEYCESVRQEASLLLAKSASEQIFKKYPSTDYNAKQKFTDTLALNICDKGNGGDFARLFFNHFRHSLIGISTFFKTR